MKKIMVLIPSLFLFMAVSSERVVRNLQLRVQDIDEVLVHSSTIFHKKAQGTDKYYARDGTYQPAKDMEVGQHFFDIRSALPRNSSTKEQPITVSRGQDMITFRVISELGWKNFTDKLKQMKENHQKDKALQLLDSTIDIYSKLKAIPSSKWNEIKSFRKQFKDESYSGVGTNFSFHTKEQELINTANNLENVETLQEMIKKIQAGEIETFRRMIDQVQNKLTNQQKKILLEILDLRNKE